VKVIDCNGRYNVFEAIIFDWPAGGAVSFGAGTSANEADLLVGGVFTTVVTDAGTSNTIFDRLGSKLYIKELAPATIATRTVQPKPGEAGITLDQLTAGAGLGLQVYLHQPDYLSSLEFNMYTGPALDDRLLIGYASSAINFQSVKQTSSGTLHRMSFIIVDVPGGVSLEALRINTDASTTVFNKNLGFDASSKAGLVVRTKAGAPTDADFTSPVDGLVAVDTTNNKIYVRIGGAWKSVTVS